MQKTILDDFLTGKYPKCLKAPHGTHVKVAGMGVKKPYCLHCRVLLTTPKNKSNN